MASGTGTMAGSVKVEIMENGDRTEDYFWELCPRPLGNDADRLHLSGVPLAKPTFQQGVFSDPDWREKLSGTYFGGKFTFEIPYPEETSCISPYVWILLKTSVGVQFRNGEFGEFVTEREGEHPTGSGVETYLRWKADKTIVVACRVGRGEEYQDSWEKAWKKTWNLPLLVRIKIFGARSGNPLMSATRNSSDLSDFKLLCEGEKFLCHKYVLSLCSPVFKRMFLSQTKENVEGEVAIVDVPKDVLGLMLAWMYGENIVPKLESLQQRMELFILADRYMLKAVKESLVSDILNAVNRETAFDVYALGDACNEERFKTKGTEAMKQERKSVLENKEVFNECRQRFPQLMQEILKGD